LGAPVPGAPGRAMVVDPHPRDRDHGALHHPVPPGVGTGRVGLGPARTSRRMIRIQDVSASYFTPAGQVQALDHVSLTIRDAEVLGIAGESGCGKSTLIKVVYQFVEPPLRLLSGRVEAT